MNFPITHANFDQVTVEQLRTVYQFHKDDLYELYLELLLSDEEVISGDYEFDHETLRTDMEDFDIYHNDTMEQDIIPEPVFECDHAPCHSIGWDLVDCIRHHACLTQNDHEIINCPTCNDRIMKGNIIPCKLQPIATDEEINRRTIRYLKQRGEGIFVFKRQIFDQIDVFKQRFFKTKVFEELIQTALHPSRIQKQLNQFDDVESFFEAIGC